MGPHPSFAIVRVRQLVRTQHPSLTITPKSALSSLSLPCCTSHQQHPVLTTPTLVLLSGLSWLRRKDVFDQSRKAWCAQASPPSSSLGSSLYFSASHQRHYSTRLYCLRVPIRVPELTWSLLLNIYASPTVPQHCTASWLDTQMKMSVWARKESHPRHRFVPYLERTA